MCERDEVSRRILSRHFPSIPIYDDIRTITDPPPAEVYIGGFPCNDISNAGTKEGIQGEQSGLWREYHRLIRMGRPRYVVIENVAALLGRGLDAVLCSLAEIGYDAEWETVSACAFGAPHVRERVFIVAYPHVEGQLQQERCFSDERRRTSYRRAQRSGRSWATEPPLARMVHGLPGRLDREQRLGLAVCPPVAEYVAHCVRSHAKQLELWRKAA